MSTSFYNTLLLLYSSVYIGLYNFIKHLRLAEQKETWNLERELARKENSALVFYASVIESLNSTYRKDLFRARTVFRVGEGGFVFVVGIDCSRCIQQLL